MWFESRHLWFPKDPSLPGDYEDALAVSQSRRTIAIADGVSTAIFSRRWAELVTTKAILEPISFTGELDTDSEQLSIWLEDLQKTWRSDVKPNSLPWHQQPKAISIGGQTTLLFASLNDLPDRSDEDTHGTEPLQSKLRVDAIGDCNLFLIRDGQKTLSFPIQTSDAFAEPPNVISSITKPGAIADHFQSLDTVCFEGDLLVFCSDAVGLWATRTYENGNQVDWLRYWDNPTEWQQEICTARDRSPSDPMRMRVDDCTLLLLKIIKEKPEEIAEDIFPKDALAGFELLIKTKEAEETAVNPEPTEDSTGEDSNGSDQVVRNDPEEERDKPDPIDNPQSNLPEDSHFTTEAVNRDESNSSSSPKTVQGYSDENHQAESESGFEIIEDVEDKKEREGFLTKFKRCLTKSNRNSAKKRTI